MVAVVAAVVAVAAAVVAVVAADSTLFLGVMNRIVFVSLT